MCSTYSNDIRRFDEPQEHEIAVLCMKVKQQLFLIASLGITDPFILLAAQRAFSII